MIVKKIIIINMNMNIIVMINAQKELIQQLIIIIYVRKIQMNVLRITPFYLQEIILVQRIVV